MQPSDGLGDCSSSKSAEAPSQSWAAVATLPCKAAQLDGRPAFRVCCCDPHLVDKGLCTVAVCGRCQLGIAVCSSLLPLQVVQEGQVGGCAGLQAVLLALELLQCAGTRSAGCHKCMQLKAAVQACRQLSSGACLRHRKGVVDSPSNGESGCRMCFPRGIAQFCIHSK